MSSVKKNSVEFRNIGGSFQFTTARPEDLRHILELDPALWAALAAPVAMLNTDKRFLDYLDSDRNGSICVDDLQEAIRLVFKYLKDIRFMDNTTPGLPADAILDSSDEGRTLAGFVREHSGELTEDGVLLQDKVAAKLHEEEKSPFKGDGHLLREVVQDGGAETLFDEICAYAPETLSADGKTRSVTLEQLEQFEKDARSFLEWANTAECPLFRGQEPVALYEVYRPLKTKLDEYFSFCDLVRLDEGNLKRFQLNAESLPPLQLDNPESVQKLLQSAPLAMPNPRACLDLSARLNPCYQDALEKFGRTFGFTELAREQYLKLKADFVPYEEYLDKAHGNSIGAIGKEKLQAILTQNAADCMRKLFVRDSLHGTVLSALRTLDMLLLYKTYLMDLVNNFVSFRALFSPEAKSMLQAGRLVMDARTFYLTLVISNVAEHKKIAAASNLSILYLQMTPNVPGGKAFYLASAVTGGDLSRVYIGKPVYFISNAGEHYCGKIVDILEGPISFWQTVFAPFRRLAAAIGSKMQKLTDFSPVGKQLETAITNGKLPPAPAPAPASAPAAAPPASKGFFGGNGSMFLLAGGISVAALGAAFSFLMKSVVGMVESLNKMSGWSILVWGSGIALCILAPFSLNAYLKMRRRNLTLFLEASGWAVNLPMRLNVNVSSLFTRGGVYPAGTRFNRTEWVKKIRRFSWCRVCIVLGFCIFFFVLGAVLYFRR